MLFYTENNEKSNTMKKKVFATVIATALILCCAIGATFAWLSVKTSEVKNTFTVGNINISLWENKIADGGKEFASPEATVTANDGYVMVPGATLVKNPTVTVEANSEDCWVFIKVKKSSNFDTFMSYLVNSAWTQLDTAEDDGYEVYYLEHTSQTTDKDYSFIAGEKVTINGTVTKDQLDAIQASPSTQPTLNFTAYAIQKDSFSTATAAWDEVKNSAN